jgi:hypothetical protein
MNGLTTEEMSALRLAICTAWVIINRTGGDKPERAPTEEDARGTLVWCAGKWEALQNKDSESPDVAADLQLLRQPVPSPSEIEYWREYEAEFSEFTYANVKLWWERKELGRATEEYLRSQGKRSA